jgi:hypothetical protein
MNDEHVKTRIIGHSRAGSSTLIELMIRQQDREPIMISAGRHPIQLMTHNIIVHDNFAQKAMTPYCPTPLKADYKLLDYERDHLSSNFIGVNKKATAKRRAKKKAARKQRRKSDG